MEIEKELGGGTFGTVYLVKINGKKYALKRMDIKERHASYDKWDKYVIPEDYMLEVDIYQKLDHPNVLKMYDFKIEDNFYDIIFEIGEKNLLDYIMNEPYDVKKIAYQIVSGLLHIANKNIISSDLKLTNIITFQGGRIAIADFGISQINYCTSKDNRWTNVNSYTITYRAPELLVNIPNRINYEATEAWALGILLYEINNKRPLHWLNDNEEFDFWLPRDENENTLREFYKRIKRTCKIQKKLKKFKYSDDSELNDLIYSLLQFDPVDRLTIGEVIYHPYFNDITFDHFITKRENILSCETKIITQQFLNYNHSKRNEGWSAYLQKNLINNNLYPRILKIFNSVRILYHVFQLCDRYYDLEIEHPYDYKLIFFTMIYLSIRMLDRNGEMIKMINSIQMQMEGAYPNMDVDELKLVIDHIFISLEGKFIFTTPIDFVDMSGLPKDISANIHRRIFTFLLTDLTFIFDSQVIAVYSIEEEVGANRIPESKRLEYIALQKQIEVEDKMKEYYQNIKDVMIIL